MTTTTARPLSPDTLATFRQDGVVVLRGLFADWIAPLREGARRNLANPGPLHRNYTQGQARFFGDYCNWAMIPEFADFVRNSPAGEVARQLMGSLSGVQFYLERLGAIVGFLPKTLGFAPR